MSSSTVRIERLVNGFEVSFSDPDVVAANAKNDRYKDPEVEMVFTDAEAVIKFLQKHLDKFLPEETYDSAFMKFIKE
jgi:hypothetical protein